MASDKLRKAQSEEGDEVPMDMSSMIDLVFLLLIFFMVSSRLISLQLDKKVEPPYAKNAIAGESVDARIVINIYEDGTIRSQDNDLDSKDDIELYVSKEKKRFADEFPGIEPRIHLRAHRIVETRTVKKVIQAAGTAGVSQVIFASYAQDQAK